MWKACGGAPYGICMAAIVFLLSAKDLTSEIGQAILTLEFDRIRDLDTSKQTSTNIKIKINQKIKKERTSWSG